MPDGGRIIAIVYAPGGQFGSWQSWVGMGSAQGATVSLCRYFAVALAKRGITVNAISPGATDDSVQFWGQIGGMLVSIPIGIWTVKYILNKDFTKYRIILVPSLESRLEAQIQDRTDTQ